jgi:transcriptional regulator with XRE-family HTH domain
MTERIQTESERQADVFQKKFMREAIELCGSQEKIATFLMVSQKTISKYKDATNDLSIGKLIRIAKFAGMNEIVIKWT